MQCQVQRLRLGLQFATQGQVELVRLARAAGKQADFVQTLAAGLQATALQVQAERAVRRDAAAAVGVQAGHLYAAGQRQAIGLQLGADVGPRRGAGQRQLGVQLAGKRCAQRAEVGCGQLQLQHVAGHAVGALRLQAVTAQCQIGVDGADALRLPGQCQLAAQRFATELAGGKTQADVALRLGAQAGPGLQLAVDVAARQARVQHRRVEALETAIKAQLLAIQPELALALEAAGAGTEQQVVQ